MDPTPQTLIDRISKSHISRKIKAANIADAVTSTVIENGNNCFLSGISFFMSDAYLIRYCAL